MCVLLYLRWKDVQFERVLSECVTMMPGKKNFRGSSLANKMKVIQDIESGEKKKCYMASEFNILRSTLLKIPKSKKKILAHKIEGKICRKSAEFIAVEKCVLIWFCECQENNILISGPFIQ